MRKFWICLFAGVVALSSLVACAPPAYPDGDPNANKFVPADSSELRIQPDAAPRSVFGVGVQLDPHFLSENVGKTGGVGENAWEVKAEDWDNIFVPRIQAMNLKRIRVMLLPSWYADSESLYTSGNYEWDSARMQSLYAELDTAKALGIKVNITMWGVDKVNCAWLANATSPQWCVDPAPDKEEAFVNVFADCIKYLIETKGYTNISEVTLYNEPNAIYTPNYGAVNGHTYYADLCKKLDAAFKEKAIRDKVLFNLSDDARDMVWLGKTLAALEGVADVVNSHTYDFGNRYDEEGNLLAEMTNDVIRETLPNYNLRGYADQFTAYDIPHIWGEFGTGNISGSHGAIDRLLPQRGTEIARIALNMFNMGSVGMSYWVLFSQYYNRSDTTIMNMGLWGFADEGYACRPVYYAYSLFTRFVEEGDLIYPIMSSDGHLVATAFRQGDKWSYLVANTAETSKKVSFLNNTKFPAAMSKYVYFENAVPTDNQVIASSGTVIPDGRVLTEQIPARSFILYTEK